LAFSWAFSRLRLDSTSAQSGYTLLIKINQPQNYDEGISMAAKKKAKSKKAKSKVKSKKPVAKKTEKVKKKVVKKKAVARKAKAKKAAPKKKPAPKPKAAPKAAPVALPGEERIGMVTHYYNHLSVAIVQLETGTLRSGETVHFRGHTSDFRQMVGSMEVNHAHVDAVTAGTSFGLRVNEHAREHDVVYRVTKP
jgi:putative protease